MEKMNSNNDSLISKGKARLALVVVLGIFFIFLLFMISIAFGPVNIPLNEVWNSLVTVFNEGPQTGYDCIIYNLRMPRVIGVFAVGMGLSVAGAVFQAIIRNPLVDPYITGVSSGAGLGATIAITSGLTLSVLPINILTPVGAFVGALVAFALTFLVAEGSGGRAINYVLGGVIIGMGFSSFTTIYMMFSGDQVHNILLFLFGSFIGVTWSNLWLIVVPILSMVFVILLYAPELNVILLGEEQAQQLGINVRRFNLFMLILASLLTACCVAFVGIIGFVGLIVPHTARMIVGGDHRLLLPSSMIIGALVMASADLIAKMAYVPNELPVGAIMTLIGVPFFAYLLIRRGKEYAA